MYLSIVKKKKILLIEKIIYKTLNYCKRINMSKIILLFIIIILLLFGVSEFHQTKPKLRNNYGIIILN
jgi:hypothetical protein